MAITTQRPAERYARAAEMCSFHRIANERKTTLEPIIINETKNAFGHFGVGWLDVFAVRTIDTRGP